MRAQNGSVQHPLAKVEASGQIRCKVCDHCVGSAAAWTAHLLSSAHKACVANLRQQAVVAATPAQSAEPTVDAPRAASLPAALPRANTSTPAVPAPLPVGFFDDAAADARAHGQDLATLQRASESAALSAFLGDLSESGQGGKAAQAAWEEEQAAAEARADTAQSEHALYKARLSLWKEGIDPRISSEQEAEAGALLDELTGMGSGKEAQDMVTQAIGKRKALLLGAGAGDASDAEGEGEEDVMDWRRKRGKR